MRAIFFFLAALTGGRTGDVGTAGELPRPRFGKPPTIQAIRDGPAIVANPQPTAESARPRIVSVPDVSVFFEERPVVASPVPFAEPIRRSFCPTIDLAPLQFPPATYQPPVRTVHYTPTMAGRPIIHAPPAWSVGPTFVTSGPAFAGNSVMQPMFRVSPRIVGGGLAIGPARNGTEC